VADLSLSTSSQSPETFLNLILPSLKPLGNLTWATHSALSDIVSALKKSSVVNDVQMVSGPDGAQVDRSPQSLYCSIQNAELLPHYYVARQCNQVSLCLQLGDHQFTKKDYQSIPMVFHYS
jgi:hypothetical protein